MFWLKPAMRSWNIISDKLYDLFFFFAKLKRGQKNLIPALQLYYFMGRFKTQKKSSIDFNCHFYQNEIKNEGRCI